MAKWRIDPDHAAAEFTAHHMMVTLVHGQFNRVSGTVLFDPAEPSRTSARVEVDAAGIYTGVDRRDNHLRSPDFLDVGKYPLIVFESTESEAVAANNLKMKGNLTIHGFTRPVVFDVRYSGPSAFVDENKVYTTFGFHATTSIDRGDFGMAWNLDIENGGFMVSRHIDIAVNFEADLEEDSNIQHA